MQAFEQEMSIRAYHFEIQTTQILGGDIMSAAIEKPYVQRWKYLYRSV